LCLPLNRSKSSKIETCLKTII